MSTDLEAILASAPPGAIAVMLGAPYETDAVTLGSVEDGIEVLADAAIQTVPATTPATPVLDDTQRESLLLRALIWLDLDRRLLERGDPDTIRTHEAMKAYAIEQFHHATLFTLQELNNFIWLLGLPAYQPSMTIRFTLREAGYQGLTADDLGVVDVGRFRVDLSKISGLIENLSNADAAVTVDAIELSPEPVHAYYRALPEPVLTRVPNDDPLLTYGSTVAVSGGLDGTATTAVVLLMVDSDWVEVIGAGDVLRVRRNALGTKVTDARHRLPVLAAAVERLAHLHRELAARARAGSGFAERMAKVRSYLIGRNEAGIIGPDELAKFFEIFGLAEHPEQT
jgi:hypothetical protein